MAADTRIQDLIRSEFGETTVLTIAHRLATVSEYDRILVLSEGRVVEFDTPSKLLADSSSVYSQLVQASQSI